MGTPDRNRKEESKYLYQSNSRHRHMVMATASSTSSNSTQSKKNEQPEYLVCAACYMPIKGVVVEALGQTWHAEHFICTHCKNPIRGNKFNVNEGRPYCEMDFAQLFLKRCCVCKLPIRDIVILALGRFWHRDHFVCTGCGTKLNSSSEPGTGAGFYEKEDSPYCQLCYQERFCPKCHECGLPIADTAVSAQQFYWHRECFKCRGCSVQIEGAMFDIIQGKHYCPKCSLEVEATKHLHM